MKQAMSLGDFKGMEKGRNTRKVTGDLSKIVEAGTKLGHEGMPFKKIAEITDPILSTTELDVPLLIQYLQYYRTYPRNWGAYTGYLLTKIAERNRAQGKPTELYFNGEGHELSGLFAGAKGIDLIVLENIEGERILERSQIKNVAAIGTLVEALDCQTALLILENYHAPNEDMHLWVDSQKCETLIADQCDEVNIVFENDRDGIIILNNCQDVSLESKERRRCARMLCCNGDLSWVSPSYFSGGVRITKKAIITGECYARVEQDGHYGKMPDHKIKNFFSRGAIRSQKAYDKVFADHKLHLLEELRNPDVTGERKIEIVKIIDAARYK